MRLFAFSLLFAAASSMLLAQPRGAAGGPGVVSGVVFDSASAEPLRVATVAIFNAADSTLATGALTDKAGAFSIAGLRPGRYYARISFLGYAPRFVSDIEITPTAPRAELGRIMLAMDAVSSGEVTVTARKDIMSVEIDRTSYRASDMPVAAGGNATDVLRNIPSIEVDVDGNVSLRGNQNVVVLLNGRAVTMSGDALTAFLQNLPANSIERIEVIPNPSAKYDPEGMSGIINIVLKEQGSRGLSGGVNAGAGTQESYSGGFNLAYGEGPWSLYGNYGFTMSGRSFTGERTQRNFVGTIAPRLDQTSEGEHRWLGHSINASIEYAFDARNSLALNGIINPRSSESGDTNRYYERTGEGTLFNRYDRMSSEVSDAIAHDYRLSYKWVAEASKHELTAEARVTADLDQDDTDYTQQTFDLNETPANQTPGLQRVDNTEDNMSGTLQLDYIRPIGEGGRLETGYKSEIEQTEADLFSESFDYGTDIFRPDTSVNNAFEYIRQIHAVYGIYAQDFGAFGVQVGARLEQVLSTFDLTTTGESFDNDYFSVFPSAFVTYKPNDNIVMKASYSRRINRPWLGIINPFVSQSDPTFVEIGNPSIKPEYIDAAELSFNHFSDVSSLTVTPYWRRTTDVIRRYGDLDSATGVGMMTFKNFDESISVGADIIASVRFSERHNVFASASLYQMTTDASNVEEGLGSDAFGWNTRVNATLGLLEGMDMQLTWFYRSPWALEGGGEVAAMQSTDVALTQRFMEGRARVGLRVSDIFDQRGFSVSRVDPQYEISFSRKPSSRTAMLTLSYTFGTPDSKARRRPTQQAAPPEMEGGW